MVDPGDPRIGRRPAGSTRAGCDAGRTGGNWPWRSTKWRPNFRNTARAPRRNRPSPSHDGGDARFVSGPDFLFWTRKGRIELKNPAAEVLASGLHLDGQLPDKLQAIARNTLASGENFLPDSFNEVITYRINGVDKFFLPRVLAMRNRRTPCSGWRWFLHDVTRFRLLDATKNRSRRNGQP